MLSFKDHSTRKFECTLKVRGYELDGYGHVNHAVYLNYFEYARFCMIEECGCGVDYFSKRNLSPVIARVEVDYRAPCFLGEELRVETSLVELRSRVAVFDQKIFKEKTKLAAKALVTLCCVDSTGKAQSLPEDFLQYFGSPLK